MLKAGASPRASRTLFQGIKAAAAMEGRDYAIPEDVQKLAIPVLAHRVVLTGEGLDTFLIAGRLGGYLTFVIVVTDFLDIDIVAIATGFYLASECSDACFFASCSCGDRTGAIVS